MKKAVITGVTGQDGSYLAEFLIHKGYEVHGFLRRSSSATRSRIDHIPRKDELGRVRLALHYADLLDTFRLSELLARIRPDEIYNLAAQSHVRVSFEQPISTAQFTGLGALAMLEAVRLSAPGARYYQASTSEMFGSENPPQDEKTRFHPRSPYGVAKVFAHWSTVNYREAHGLFACSGILFNHESPRRGQSFVTKKIAMAAARISAGLQSSVSLGNIAAVRDWGYAPEYVVAMWKMLQLEDPSDFVIATGTGTTVREFAQASFARVDLLWEDYVETDETMLRPAEVDALIGNPSEARNALSWSAKMGGSTLAMLMTDWELSALEGATVDKLPPDFWDSLTDGISTNSASE